MGGGGGGGNNLAVVSHFSSGLADCQPIFVSWPDFTAQLSGGGVVGPAYTRQNQLLHKIRQ